MSVTSPDGAAFHLFHRVMYYRRDKQCRFCARKHGRPRKDAELVYAATARCMCGAGLAYPTDARPKDAWDCSDILTGRAVPKGVIGSVLHDTPRPFVFYEIKSEHQPSANGQTTRRKP